MAGKIKIGGSKPTGSSKSGRSLGKLDQALEKSKNKEWLKIADGQTVIVRVLDTGEDFLDAYVHRVPMQGKKGTFYADVPCLDQDEKGIPCPGCKDGLDKRYKFWANVIARDEDGDSKKDKLMVWGQGITIARRLGKLHKKFGLDNRDIEVEREGSTKDDTSYNIDWAEDSNSALSAHDQELAKHKHDLSRYAKPPEFDDFYKTPGDRGEDEGDPGEASAKRQSFKPRNRSSNDGEKGGGSGRTSTGLKRLGNKGSSGSKPSAKVTVRRRGR